MSTIDLKNYEGGREQAYVKHYLLEKYLSRWGYKIGSKWALTHTLTERYRQMARHELRNMLLAERSKYVSSYPALFGRTMSFPLVFPHDLVTWIDQLKPYITIEFAKSKGRLRPRKPSPFEEDRIIVLDRDAVSGLL